MLRRMQVQTDDVSRFVFKIRIIAGHVPFQSVRFQLRLRQNPLHRGLAEAQLARQFPAGPVRAAVPWFLLHSPDHVGLDLGRCGTRLTALMTALQPRPSVSFEPHFPAGDGGQTGSQTFRNLAISSAIGQRQDESCAKYISRRQGS